MSSIMEQAAAKLRKELTEVKQPYLEKPIVDYLCSNLDEPLATNIALDHKSLKKCIDYITAEARKKLNSKNGALPDQEVFDMAIAYFQRDDAEEERKKAEEKKKRDEEAAKRKAEAKTKPEKSPKVAPAAKKNEKQNPVKAQLSFFDSEAANA